MSGVAYVDGIALWAPRLPGWATARAVFRAEADAPAAPAPRPAPALLPPTERRRAPDTVAIALEVATQACTAAARDPARLRSVFASTHGDLPISDYMCETLASATPALLSPTKFHNSVHNAAAGYWTIGHRCNASSTALSAFHCTFGAGLLEAAAQLACDDEPVLYVAYDIEAKGPMATVTASRGQLGAALVLAPAHGERSVARVAWRVVPRAGNGAPPARHAALVDGNPLAGALSLFEALALAAPARVQQPLSATLALELALDPVAA
jgi:hypothetical protein